MGDPVVTLGENELHRIGDYVRSNLKGWFYEAVPEVASLAGGVSNAQILERIVRVEERFETVDVRFEAMDKRFENLIRHMDKRFETVDKRFEDLIHHMDGRFETVNKRFEDVNDRFVSMDGRFASMDRRFSRTQWLIGFGILLLGTLMSVYQFLN